MSICERRGDCAFFNNMMQRMPVDAGLFRDTYCNSNKQDCARYMVHQRIKAERLAKDKRLLVDRVMKNLYPNDNVKAKEVIGWFTKS